MFKQKLLGFSFVLLLALSVVIAGCDDNSVGSEPGMGTMEVVLHDAPVDYEEVNVYVESVMVNNADTDTGWVEISSPQQTYDLLELTNGATEVLGSRQLPAGTYNQIRLMLSQNGHSVVIDSAEHDMFVPSGTQTGVKLDINAEIEEDITYTLLLDFDASRSIVRRGSGQAGTDYLLKPVISATNQAITGNIAGAVDPSEAEPFVYAISGSDTLSSTKADTTGSFELIGLEEGSYTVTAVPTNDGYQSASANDVSVTVDETNNIGTITLPQN